MIPLRLTVKNFMCYRDNVPPLELENIHVACLCGDNGNGKSALLDAITWVLWGASRARTQDELIHQGQQDMAVELEFLARGQRYRVSRRHSRAAQGRQGATILDLQVYSEDGFVPISGNSVRETEARLRDILHMDYDTFVNTAFLLQGKADRFTTSTPAERKECLAEVLGLSFYDKLEERAREKGRAARDKIRQIETTVAVKEQRAARKPEVEERLASVKATLEQLTPQVDAQRATAEELQRNVDALRRQRHELDDLTRRLKDYQGEIAHLQRQLKAHQARAAEYESLLQREEEISTQAARLQQCQAELARLSEVFLGFRKLEGQVGQVEKAIAYQQAQLSAQAQQCRQRIAEELAPRAARLPELQAALEAAEQEQARLAELEEHIGGQRKEMQLAQARVTFLEDANVTLRKEMEDTRRKFDMLAQDDARCPLCRQPLGPEGQRHLRHEYESEGKKRKETFQQNAAEQKELKRKLEELASLASRLEADLKKRQRQHQSKVASLQHELEAAQKAQAELGPAQQGLEQMEARLSARDFAHDERQTLAQLRAEMAALGYDAEQHSQAQRLAAELQPYADLSRRLTEAKAKLPEERQAVEAMSQILARRQQEVKDTQERQASLQRELKVLPELESRLAEALACYQELEQRRHRALVDQATLERELEDIAAIERELQEHRQEVRHLTDEKSIYDELAVAFGKNGIQALIINEAIPQLQQDANELLARLTENRMSLKLQIQDGRKDGRTGLVSRELDIKIADEVGTRSYETFSGGEAFRINFALRIALSRLLARRSGAPLPTLFIDEGFGSQDATGQERIKEAIQSIQDDFQKIIVITHIEQIKEAFPVRIEVTKTPEGSTFTVV